MKKFLFLIVAYVTNATSGHGQTPDETFNMIGSALVTINEMNRALSIPGNTEVASELLVDAIKKVSELQKKLEDNPYVRLTSFTIDVPLRISITFEPVSH